MGSSNSGIALAVVLCCTIISLKQVNSSTLGRISEVQPAGLGDLVDETATNLGTGEWGEFAIGEPLAIENIDESRKRRAVEIGDDDLLEFRTESLGEFNAFRARAGMPPIELDDQLSEGAQIWAEHMLATGTKMMSDCEYCVYTETYARRAITSHDRDVPTGESAAEWVINKWFKKAVDNTESPFSKSLLRNKGLSKMGIGAAYSRVGDRKEVIVVARFE